MTLNLEESSEWHSHEVYELLYCRKGNGSVILDDQNITMQNRRFILIPPQVRHRFSFRHGEAANLKILCLTTADTAIHLSSSLSVWLRNMHAGHSSFSDYENTCELSDLLDKIPDTFGETDKESLEIIWSRIALILAFHLKQQGKSESKTQPHHADKIRKICDWIDCHLDAHLDLNTIAAEFGMSRSLLTKEFRKHTNSSIIEYMNIRRLQKAGSLLSETEMSIADTAFACGFPTIGNFYRQFKELYGVTPTEFRKVFTIL